MDNQHRKISGYRELNQEEVDLMNRIKAMGPQLDQLIADVNLHIFNTYEDQRLIMRDESKSAEERAAASQRLEQIGLAQPARWVAMARTDLQTGLMKLTRAVAQPTFF